MSRAHHLPTPKELAVMKEDLAFKENEMKKSEATASGLAGGECFIHIYLQKLLFASGSEGLIVQVV